MGALAYSMVLGRRQERMMVNFRPHNVSLITLGTILLWFGWLGFNGGSAFGANLRAVMSMWNSNLAAISSGITWVLLDFRLARKWSMVGLCSGFISGLVAATPASGYIPISSSILLGVITGAICNYSTKIKYIIRIDDSLDIFAEHGVAGMVGLLFIAFFGTADVIGMDGVNVNYPPAGWLDHNWKQLYKQFAYILVCSVYAFVVSAIIAFIINFVPGLHLRASEEAEVSKYHAPVANHPQPTNPFFLQLMGMDDDQIGEFAYDYVEVRRDYLAWTPNHNKTPIEPIARHSNEHNGMPTEGVPGRDMRATADQASADKREEKRD